MKCEFKIILNNNPFCPYITSDLDRKKMCY